MKRQRWAVQEERRDLDFRIFPRNGENLLSPFFVIPSLNYRPRLCARASLVRTNLKKNFREKGKQRIFLNVDLTPELLRVWEDKVCESSTFASMTSRADTQRVPNDDDSMNRRKIERVDENILTTYSRKFRGGILPQEDRREKCAKWTRRRSDRIVK